MKAKERAAPPKCGAKTRQGGTCAKPAGWGTQHVGAGACKLHGGSMATHQLGAQIVLEERRARTLLERLGAPEPLGNPVDELLAVAAENRAWLAILRERVDELGDLTTKDRLDVIREHAVVLLYERALDRTNTILSGLVKLNLDARRVALDEMQVEMVHRALSAALSELPRQYQEPARQRLVLALRKEVVA